jgi:hypothetical protein
MNVNPARLGHRGAELRERQRAEHRQDAADHPDGEHQPRVDGPGDLGVTRRSEPMIVPM